MNLRRKINVWIVTYCSITALFGVFVILMAYFVNTQIENNSKNIISEIPIYKSFDNQIRRNTFKLVSEDYNEMTYMNGYVINVDDTLQSISTINIEYKYYKTIQIGDELLLDRKSVV